MTTLPLALGTLGGMLGGRVQERINAELDRDLMHLNEKKLFDYLDKIVWV